MLHFGQGKNLIFLYCFVRIRKLQVDIVSMHLTTKSAATGSVFTGKSPNTHTQIYSDWESSVLFVPPHFWQSCVFISGGIRTPLFLCLAAHQANTKVLRFLSAFLLLSILFFSFGGVYLFIFASLSAILHNQSLYTWGRRGRKGKWGNRALKAPLHSTRGRHSHGSTLLEKQSDSLSAIRTDPLVVNASTDAADASSALCLNHLHSRCYPSSDEQRQHCHHCYFCYFLLKCCVAFAISLNITVESSSGCLCVFFVFTLTPCLHMFIFVFVLICVLLSIVCQSGRFQGFS